MDKLTGEGFTVEEADELYEEMKKLPLTAEEREKHLLFLYKVTKERQMLTEREIEILNCMIDAWDANEAPMIGGVSYDEVFKLLERLGLKKPVKLIAWIEKRARILDVLAAEAQEQDMGY